MARVSVSGTELTLVIPAPVQELLEGLWAGGHAAYVVGGSLRDALLGRSPADWDLATDARPDRIQVLFPSSVYENRFGTVTVRKRHSLFEITTFRADGDYVGHRRPAEVRFAASIEEDLARRDFTVNAIAWGAGARRATRPMAGFVDPFDGQIDLRRHVLRAVGEPEARFREDALRMIRAVRLAAALDFSIDPATLSAIAAQAGLASRLSGERLYAELTKLLHTPRPSVGLRLMADTGLLAVVAPELERQRGIPQNKVAGDDLWDHVLGTVDAAPRDRPIVRLAALLHDVGKPLTLADGRFIGHELAGAKVADGLLERFRAPRHIRDRVGRLVGLHMFSYEPKSGDSAVRRFIRRVGSDLLDDLLSLRAADNVGSGLPAGAGHLDELRARCDAQIAASVALDVRHLAVKGEDLMAELNLPEGPAIGRLLDDLLELVMSRPELNTRPALLAEARRLLRASS